MNPIIALNSASKIIPNQLRKHKNRDTRINQRKYFLIEDSQGRGATPAKGTPHMWQKRLPSFNVTLQNGHGSVMCVIVPLMLPRSQTGYPRGCGTGTQVFPDFQIDESTTGSLGVMRGVARIAPGGWFYHVLNRAVARLRLFRNLHLRSGFGKVRCWKDSRHRYVWPRRGPGRIAPGGAERNPGSWCPSTDKL